MLRTNVAHQGMRSPSGSVSAASDADDKYGAKSINKVTKAADTYTFNFFKYLATRSGIEKTAVLLFLIMLVRGHRFFSTDTLTTRTLLDDR